MKLRIARRQAFMRWGLLLAGSAGLIAVLEILHLPAAMLLGAMASASVLAAIGGEMRVHPAPQAAAQTLIGLLVARSITAPILLDIFGQWPLFLAVICSVILASSAIGWLLAASRVLPGTTAVWGTSPGAALAMVLMSEAHGADPRLVAFMQYLRVVLVTVVASVTAHLMTGGSSAASPPSTIVWFPPVDWGPLASTLGLAAAAALIAVRLRIQSGIFLLPLVAGIVLQDLGVMAIELPPWLLAGAYVLVGWTIGLRFTRQILVHAFRALPQMMLAMMALIGICGLVASALVVFAGVDPLTAYLATSPGGLDSVAIIAASSQVDAPFVMSMQTARLMVVMLAGPAIARFVAHRISARLAA